MIVILVIVLSVHILVQLICLLRLLKKPPVPKRIEEWPFISIWVAARNEENNIINCLQSLERLDYPAGKLEILIGNDHSTDRTVSLVEDFIRDKDRFKLVHVGDDLGKARGKANVLAWLAEQSHGDYYLIADADVEVKPCWAREHVKAYDGNTGTVSGTTVIRENDLFSAMQGLDWLYFLGLIKVFAEAGVPCTAIGNNMSVRKEAYLQTGGYPNIDFSITEDYKLFREILSHGWTSRQLLRPASTNISAPSPDFSSLMKQRKRWLTGGRELPFYWKLIIVLLAVFFPAFIALLFFNWKLAVSLWLLRLIVQSLTLAVLRKRTGQHQLIHGYLLYEFYSTFLSLITPLYLMIPAGRTWKGREY